MTEFTAVPGLLRGPIKRFWFIGLLVVVVVVVLFFFFIFFLPPFFCLLLLLLFFRGTPFEGDEPAELPADRRKTNMFGAIGEHRGGGDAAGAQADAGRGVGWANDDDEVKGGRKRGYLYLHTVQPDAGELRLLQFIPSC